MPMTLSRFHPGLSTLLFALAIWSLFLPQDKMFADDPGVGWHLATGQYILDAKTIPHTDPFLSLEPAKEWISDQWLADIALYLGFEVGGWKLLYAVFLIIFILTFYGILLSLIKKESSSFFASTVAATCAFKMAQIHFILRPVLLSFPLFAALLWLLYGRFNRVQRLCGLAVLFALWVNLHGSFLIGLLLVVLWGITRFDIVSPVVSALFSLCNPYGGYIFKSALALGQSTYFMRLHMEWMPTDFARIEGQILEFVLIVLLAALAIRREKFRLSLFEGLSILLFAHLSLHSIRFLPYFGMVVAIPLARALACFDLWAATNRTFSRIEGWEKNSVVVKYAPYVLSVVALVLIITGNGGEGWTAPLGPSASVYPYKGAEWLIEKSKETGKPLNILAPFDWGGFLVWEGRGQLRPTVDDRNQVVGEAIHRKVSAAFKPMGEWQKVGREFKADYLLIPKGSYLGAVIEKYEGIKPLFQDDVSLIYKVP